MNSLEIGFIVIIIVRSVVRVCDDGDWLLSVSCSSIRVSGTDTI